VRNKLFGRSHRHQNFHQDMTNNNFHTVHNLKIGESAMIKDILGGRQFINKAESLGIRKGIQITKISSQIMQGPITVKVGQTQIAIGHRMANRIIIE
jgi:ferrous iron transport protein A